MKHLSKWRTPTRVISIGFLIVILIGSLLLMLPFSVKAGAEIDYIDALYTAVSAVCVTGLATVDIGVAFSPVGHVIIAVLIQIGGLGVASVGAGMIMAMRKKLNFRERNIIREASNLSYGNGIVPFLKKVFLITILFEGLGAVLLLAVFAKDFPISKAVGYSVFHAISAFNNAGFDILGLSGDLRNGISIIPYRDNISLNIITSILIVFGGIGFLVIDDVVGKCFNWKKFSMHTKIVISTSTVLIIAGMLLLKITEDISWLGAFFQSVSARTAGFATYSVSGFSNAGLLIMCVLMFIGASSGSTGGGIKTSTFFALIQGIKASATNKSEKGFHYGIPKGTFRKASVITLLGISIIIVGMFFVLLMEANLDFRDVFFEVTSAFGTVGLSTGITSSLCTGSKIICMIIMFIGRLGPLTIATLWYFSPGERIEYADGNIAIG